MKLVNALKKLENAGYSINNNGTFYSAQLKTVTISFIANIKGECSKFTFNSTSSCAPTYGLSLKTAME